LLKRKNSRKPNTKTDHYSLAHGEYKTKQGYRLLWVHSTQKAEQDAETRQRQVEAALEAIRGVQAKLNRYKFKKRKSIEQALKNILRDTQCNKRIHWQLHIEHKYKIGHGKRGRPKSQGVGEKTWTPHYSLSFSINAQEIEQEIRTDGVFPLITNCPEKEFEPKRVLEIYKFQPFLEKRHAHLKTWQEATPALLKKPERVVAYLHVHILSLMVGSLIERSLRQAMHKAKILALPLYPEGRACKYPTVFDIVRLFENVERYEVEDGQKVTIFPAKLSSIQKEVLRFLEIPLSLYS
jgi:transposase